MVIEQRQAHRRALGTPHEIVYEHEIAQRLAHLDPVQADESDVHPVLHEGRAGDRFALGALTLVVGKGQIAAAPVYVDGDAKFAQRQRRALDVPARSPRSPARLPGRFVLEGGLPEHEIERVAFVGIVGFAAVDGGQIEHRRARLVADLAEAGELRDLEVDRPVDLIGDARVEGAADQREDLRDGTRRARLGEDGEQVDELHVALEGDHLFGGQVQIVDAQLASLAQDVVVDVGDVANAVHLVTEVDQSARQHVKGEVDVGVTEVRRVIRGDAAAIERRHRTDVEREDATTGAVVELHHSGSPASFT